ncbi:hypothetical protein WN51_14703 [Melipona quadrifasciata]|uniref:Uncharacterized protein n=1 Tax=Melipona quadrifasciata TaxID=166423 RepID=A0A0M9A0B1_9HYME|nr:hypothetical protein WN51_14703 [Melipona quadrifasciata]
MNFAYPRTKVKVNLERNLQNFQAEDTESTPKLRKKSRKISKKKELDDSNETKNQFTPEENWRRRASGENKPNGTTTDDFNGIDEDRQTRIVNKFQRGRRDKKRETSNERTKAKRREETRR